MKVESKGAQIEMKLCHLRALTIVLLAQTNTEVDMNQWSQLHGQRWFYQEQCQKHTTTASLCAMQARGCIEVEHNTNCQ
jgi:hypothetical protein